MSDFGLGLVLVGLVALVGWAKKKEEKDRKENPEKWAKIDADNLRKVKEKQTKEYDEAMKRVPPSEWMRMNRHEKADVLQRREAAEEKKRSRESQS